MPQAAERGGAVVGAPGEETGVARGACQHRQDDRHHRQACALELVEVCEGGRRKEGRDHSLQHDPAQEQRVSPAKAPTPGEVACAVAAVGLVEARFHGAKDHRSGAQCLRSQPPFPRQGGAYRDLPGSPRPLRA